MKTIKIAICASIAALAATTSQAQIPIEFFGTPGSTPVSVTFSDAVNFTITNSASTGDFLLFTIQNLFGSNDGEQHFITSFSSVLQYDINGGALNTIAGWDDDGYSSGDVTGDDEYFWITLGQNLNPGDVITLNMGTLTSEGDAPADFNLGTSGNYEMFIADAGSGDGGLDISDPGVTPTPEPSTLALVGLGSLSLLMFRCRK